MAKTKFIVSAVVSANMNAGASAVVFAALLSACAPTNADLNTASTPKPGQTTRVCYTRQNEPYIAAVPTEAAARKIFTDMAREYYGAGWRAEVNAFYVRDRGDAWYVAERPVLPGWYTDTRNNVFLLPRNEGGNGAAALIDKCTGSVSDPYIKVKPTSSPAASPAKPASSPVPSAAKSAR